MMAGVDRNVVVDCSIHHSVVVVAVAIVASARKIVLRLESLLVHDRGIHSVFQ